MQHCLHRVHRLLFLPALGQHGLHDGGRRLAIAGLFDDPLAQGRRDVHGGHGGASVGFKASLESADDSPETVRRRLRNKGEGAVLVS